MKPATKQTEAFKRPTTKVNYPTGYNPRTLTVKYRTQWQRKFMIITIVQDIELSDISDLLCSALEGGSNYWYFIQDFIKPKIWAFDDRPISKTKEEANKLTHSHFAHCYPLNEGGALMIDDSQADEPELGKPVRLDLDSIRNGLKLMAQEYPRHWKDFVTNQADAITGDVFLQLCVFGKLVYG